MRVLFVCLGNICRSPTAEGVVRHLAREAGVGRQWHLDSAGTGNYHLGEAPDERSQRAARRRGIDLSALRARQVCAEDFHRFDLILGMDHANLRALQGLRPASAGAMLGLFLDYAPQLKQREVPDPYFDGEQGFETVLDLCFEAGRGLLNHAAG
ncbi:MAG: low molecular weight phosphotyrosine protein phosphatase [Proteobacteria bacterium]|nr:low molecular weight phosphotyrosine protein phosphatase [Pseudomonadota bacterium]